MHSQVEDPGLGTQRMATLISPTGMPKILLVEDDTVLSETLRYNFEHAGYDTLLASDGVVGLETARTARPDLIILDVMLPRLDGFSICRILRRESDVPIILLTARQDEMDRIHGLDLGANDYVVKPFSLGELLARIRAQLRQADRPRQPIEREILTADELRIDLGSRRVFRGAVEITLAQKEFDLLVCFMRNRGLALARHTLLEQVWGRDFAGSARTLDVHVRWLRQKIESEPERPYYIQTVRGIGYRFTEHEE
jgi:DNA-binding response OmpR family regulator